MKAGNVDYCEIGDIPQDVPIFPLSGALLLPGGQMPLNIFEKRYLTMVDDAIAGNRLIAMVQPCMKPDNARIDPPKLSTVGCLGRVTAFQETGDGRYLISLSGICRYKISEEVPSNNPYRKCRIEPFEYDLQDHCGENLAVCRDRLLTAFRNYLEANDMDADWETVNQTDTDTLVTALCMMSPYEPAEKQALLEAPDIEARAETLIAISEMHLARQAGGNNGQLQ